MLKFNANKTSLVFIKKYDLSLYTLQKSFQMKTPYLLHKLPYVTRYTKPIFSSIEGK